jgi:RecQ-mediated genome instability protein 1
MSTIQEHIKAHLFTSKSLPVSPSWLSNFLASTSQQQQRAPLSALTQTALFRILASNFTESLSTSTPSALLPGNVSDPTVKERRIPGPVPVQVLDIEDIGSSLWSQVEAIERVERGETVRGREIVRNVDVGGGDEGSDLNPSNRANTEPGNSRASTSNGPHRLVLQDAAGTKVIALELKPVEGIAIGKLPIGAKLLLRNTIVARGMVLLSPETVTLLGGKIEAMDTAWRRGRKESLLARIEAIDREQRERVANGDTIEEE